MTYYFGKIDLLFNGSSFGHFLELTIILMFFLLKKILVKEKLQQDPDSEIALTSLKVSLCCPVSIDFIFLLLIYKSTGHCLSLRTANLFNFFAMTW